MLDRFQKLVDRRALRPVELPIYFEIIARNDVVQDEHHVSFGPGQYSGMKRLLAALENWQKETKR